MRTVTITKAFPYQGVNLAVGTVQSLPNGVAADAVNNSYATYGITNNSSSNPFSYGNGSGNVTAASNFGTDGLIITSDGTSTGVKASSTIASATVTSLSVGSLMLSVPTVDNTASGPKNADFNCGYTSSAIGDLVYLDSSSTWQKCDANTLALYNGKLGIALEVKAAGAALTVAEPGSYVYASAAFPTLTVGGPVYMSETAGAITQTAPTTTDAASRVIGWAVHADKIYFNPSADYTTHT